MKRTGILLGYGLICIIVFLMSVSDNIDEVNSTGLVVSVLGFFVGGPILMFVLLGSYAFNWPAKPPERLIHRDYDYDYPRVVTVVHKHEHPPQRKFEHHEAEDDRRAPRNRKYRRNI